MHPNYEDGLANTVDPDQEQSVQIFRIITIALTFGPLHDKTNKMICAPSKDSDQPGYLPSLIRVFAMHFKGS